MDPEMVRQIQQWQMAFSNPGTLFVITALGGSAITTMMVVGGKLTGFIVNKNGKVQEAPWSETKK